MHKAVPSETVARLAAAGTGGRNASSIHALMETPPQLLDLHAFSIDMAYASRSAPEAAVQVEARSCGRIGAAQASAGIRPTKVKQMTSITVAVFNGSSSSDEGGLRPNV